MALRRFILAVAGAAAFFCQPALAQDAASIATGQAAVTTSATLVTGIRAGRKQIILSPTSSVVFYVGGSGVSSSTGVYVAAGASITLHTAAAIYAIGASNVTLSYIEIY